MCGCAAALWVCVCIMSMGVCARAGICIRERNTEEGICDAYLKLLKRVNTCIWFRL